MRSSRGSQITLALLAIAALIIGIIWFIRTTPIDSRLSITNERTTQAPAPLALRGYTVTTEDGTDIPYQLAAPFSATIAAVDLGKARFMTESPDGRIFVPDLVDYNLSHEGKIYILDDFNEETKQFETKHTYLENLRGPNSVAFYEDESGQQWIYIALTAHLIRYPYEPGDTAPSGEPEVITTFPDDQVPGQESVVWHITRTVKFKDGRLYVAVGSGCNSCEQPADEMRGMIYHMNPDGTDKRVYADGLRNAVGFTWAGDTLYASENGDDHLGVNAPDDVMYELTEGAHYGWPYCYESDGEILPDSSRDWERPVSCSDVPLSFSAFAPHTAPLGVAYFSEAHPALENTFLVALHGSFEPNVGNGYQIVRVTADGTQEVFMDGFQTADGTRYGRPVDFLQHSEDAFFFTDDHNGRVYYVSAS